MSTQPRFLVTGIADEHSLALQIARTLKSSGAEIVCAGLGMTEHHAEVSGAGRRYLAETFDAFQAIVAKELGDDTPTVVLDASLDGAIVDACENLRERGLILDGFVHAIAMDKTIRRGKASPLLEVSRDDFLHCLSVSAYSLLGITRELVNRDCLRRGSSIVALSYLGAERAMSHAYRNIGVAKAALERISRELAFELGPSHGIRVNCVRFSPYAASRAGGAIPELVEAVERAGSAAPLGNASPEALAMEVSHLLRPNLQVTGSVRHVDGGYNFVA